MSRRRWLIHIGLVTCALLSAPQALRSEQDAVPAPSPKALDALQRLQSDDPYQRQLGFLRLEALREPATLEAIRSHRDSRDPDMRAWSLRALVAIEGSVAVPVLLERLKADREPQVRRAALLGLEPFQQTDPEILPACIKALRDRSPEVRMTAVDVVSRVNDPRARQAIFARYQRERQRDVHRVLVIALERLKK